MSSVKVGTVHLSPIASAIFDLRQGEPIGPVISFQEKISFSG
jgi:hypothetical protein